MRRSRYITHDPHFARQSRKRRIDLNDVRRAIARAARCERYDGRAPTCGGTNWRVFGPDCDDIETCVAVEAFADHLGQRALLVTVF